MKQLFIIGLIVLVCSCHGTKTYHTVKVVKPVYHNGWYKNSRWHKKIQVGRLRIRWFEKQGTKTVRMKG